MVGRGGRCLEVETLHRADTAVGPVRQEHRGHGGAVAAEAVAVVLPQRLAATELAPDLVHGGHELAVLLCGRARLVAGEVVAHPPGAEVEFAGAEIGQPVEPVLRPAVVRVERTGGERPQRKREHCDDDERGEYGGSRRHCGRPIVADVVGTAEVVGHQPEDLGQCDTRKQVDRQVVEGQDPNVPEAPLGQQQEDDCEDSGRQRQRHPQPDATDAADDGADHRQDDEHLEYGLVHEKVLPAEVAATRPERLDVLSLLSPTHVVEVLRVPVERQHPERRQESGDRAGDQEPRDLASTRPQHEEADRHHESEERREEVGEAGQCQQAPGQDAIATGPHSPGGKPDVENRDRQAHREGELPRHRRHHVAAVDVVGAVEEERQRHHGQERGPGEGQPPEAPGRVGGQRQRDDAGDRDHLHRHAVGDRHDEETPDHREGGDRAAPATRGAGEVVCQGSHCRRQHDPGDGEVHRRVVVGERLDR